MIGGANEYADDGADELDFEQPRFQNSCFNWEKAKH